MTLHGAAAFQSPDERAKKILFDAFRDPSNWAEQGTASAADFLYAKSKGLMFDELELNHDEVCARVHAATAVLDRHIVAKAFLTSLSSRRLDLRSALGSYSAFRAMPAHGCKPDDYGSCAICGFRRAGIVSELNLMNFERFKFGSIRQTRLTYAMLDLELFQSCAVPEPCAEDVELLRRILSELRQLKFPCASGAVDRALKRVLKPSNALERLSLVAVLGYCGILSSAAHPGPAEGYVPPNARPCPIRLQGNPIDLPYPACWWTVEGQLNEDAVNAHFGAFL